MIILLKRGAGEGDVEKVARRVRELGGDPAVHRLGARSVVVASGVEKRDRARLSSLSGVEKVIPVHKPYTLATRDSSPEGTIVSAGGVEIGGNAFVVAAGPCSVESRDQLFEAAEIVSSAGARVLRGGTFKTRTSPYAFQGLGVEGISLLREAGDKFGMPVVTEVTDTRLVAAAAEKADMLQIGSRSMNFTALLKEVALSGKPVLLKRGMSATAHDLLMAAEYLMNQGNTNVVLCERGIRTFDDTLRFTLDVGVVPFLKKETHLPVMVDPSHAAGRADIVEPMALASMAAGADGLLIEAHPRPEEALSDGAQSLDAKGFKTLMNSIEKLAPALGRPLSAGRTVSAGN